MRSVGPLALLALLVLIATWFALRGADEPPPVEGSGAVPADVRDASPADLEGEARPDPVQEPRAQGTDDRTDAADTTPAEDEPPSSEERYSFIGSLVRPDRSEITVAEIRATLTPDGGTALSFEGEDTDHIAFDGVAHERYWLDVDAPGYTHRPCAIDLTEAQPSGRSFSRAFTERVVLWPSLWVQIVVRTRDGRPFRELAEDLEWEPKRLFVHAFSVGASVERPTEGASAPPAQNELAHFRDPPGYQNVELPGGIAGSLELHSAPPFWVGLWVHGVFFEARMLRPGDTELVFELDLAVLERGMATVTARLVDRDSGAPVVDATATLKADTSAHRRGDLSDVAPGEDGRLVFQRVIPGQHELTILRGPNLVQRRLFVAPSEAKDLGDIPIGAGPGILLRVVDAAGEPAHAWVEIAPYRKGARVEQLYPPNLHRSTGDGATYELPVPDKPSIVRVRPTQLGGSYRRYPWVGSHNYLIDPDELPSELVVLAQDPIELVVEPLTPWIAGHELTVEDALGLVVDTANGETPSDLELDLIPGDYTIRRFEGDMELGSVDVTIDAGSKRVRCP